MSNRKLSKPFDLGLDYLLHPAGAFNHPHDVLDDPDLTTHEKRAILAAWASDACALEAVPALRRSPLVKPPVAIDEIFDALRDLDRLDSAPRIPAVALRRRRVRRRRMASRTGGPLSA